MDEFIYQGQRRLRCGYTTGSCAAAAAKAAALMLLVGSDTVPDQISLMTPKGIRLTLPVVDIARTEHTVSCAVQKDSGDDPDQTNGVLIYAQVRLIDRPEIVIDGGVGVGRITKPGLPCKVGEAAVNPGPRSQISRQLREVAEECEYNGGFSVLISVPGGEELARKTFNPRLGIEGGISILGTSGIVEPMSESALKESIRLELHMLSEVGNRTVILTPGNYGECFVTERLGIHTVPVVQCSNFIGDSLDFAAREGIETILLVGHIGKLVKLAGGIMNTHSSAADCRMELLGVHATLAGISSGQLQQLMKCVTTDDALSYLIKWNVLDNTMCSLMGKMEEYLFAKAGKMCSGAVVFSNQYGILGKTTGADSILEQIKGKRE